MKRILAAIGVTGLALLGATAPAIAGDNEKGDHKVTICHATGSDNNPYVSMTVDLNALKGHADHWGDIIPANDGKAIPEGQNLDKMDIWKAGCTVPEDHGNGNGDHDHTITICHATGWENKPYVQVTVDYKGLKDHAQHGDDIIPPTDKWGGQNWDDTGRATYENDCVPCPTEEETPPVETPPVTPPVETPPAETPPAETPPAVTPPVAPVEVPTGAVAAPPVAVAAAVTTNTGFNVQTAVASTDTGLAPWAAGLIVMMLAAAGVAARKVLQEGSLSGNRKH
ncbi:hypothetical protein [Pseudarthrobacter sulfonivorans]|uniref:hypothetical protein n=1 Tax=Pseudarthrobacter sulfonivorans TaxID=121292 RepID=UPI002105A7BC|nr:hypothetical protein [Pseudarthrobacter sulfonivorans]